jgi:hypothetical protein
MSRFNMSSASDQELLIGHIPEVTRQGDLSELWAYIQQGVSIIHSDPEIKLSAAAVGGPVLDKLLGTDHALVYGPAYV